MSTALAHTIKPEMLAELDKIAAEEFKMVQTDTAKKFTSAMMVAAQVTKIKAALTDDVMKHLILPLKDCGSLGFQTDEGQRQQSYTVEQIRTCATEAILRGAMPIGGEFMIFQGKTFFQKPFYERKVRSHPGISNIELICSTPRMMQGGALVEVTARFNIDGKPVTLERTGQNAIAVKLQGSGGADMAIGKAEKRMYRFMMSYLEGYAPPAEPDDEDGSTLRVVHNEPTQASVTETPAGDIVSSQKPAETPKEQTAQQTPPANDPPATSGNEAAKKAVRTVKPKAQAATQLPPPEEKKPEPPAPPEAPPEDPEPPFENPTDANAAAAETGEQEIPEAVEDPKEGRAVFKPVKAFIVNKDAKIFRMEVTDLNGEKVADFHCSGTDAPVRDFTLARNAKKNIEVTWKVNEKGERVAITVVGV